MCAMSAVLLTISAGYAGHFYEFGLLLRHLICLWFDKLKLFGGYLCTFRSICILCYVRYFAALLLHFCRLCYFTLINLGASIPLT